ncbi:Peptidyl-prolyl cis-trans isomerase D [Wickerhamomyces ciferrii]|uniref:Peptidyl-prolyl cis-trans isomerase-like 3 n=1 Tax=Wickerhamomyces ciferrii (strain ATCC 14091 / BCRC 22168 / CBS 111 / JCM 3599 / NBRC 0793 / NRRL Y-1031 F-60-10) TaxID=1206466 RepID=K0K7P4_WICCF|nr:Peptidyl-prolyl cis-trans isomerase D [Wickerhamomyces ciferrii]CCH40835.1 Peptidyl-prolyl cis-trans isomerase D [Wickerhamomyces ciferrii]
MVQFGDPTNTGKGGESIWGGHFEDEFKEDLRHSKRTCGKHPTLDGKYTVFGKTLKGSESDQESTLSKLENVEVDKKKRPKAPIFIKSVTIHANPLAK